MSWCTRAFPTLFACDPGAINDQEFSGIEPLKRFQAQYNAAKAELGVEADIAVEGSIGEETWGAIFDVYEFALREELGEEAAGVTALREKLTFVDPERPALGFGETQPVDSSGNGARSQPNRRIDVLFFDEHELPNLDVAEQNPRDSEIYDEGRFKLEPIETPSGERIQYKLAFLPNSSQPVLEVDFLLTPDGPGWSQSKSSKTASAQADGSRLLVFKVPKSGQYSLDMVLSDGTKVPIFTGVPHERLEQASSSRATVSFGRYGSLVSRGIVSGTAASALGVVGGLAAIVTGAMTAREELQAGDETGAWVAGVGAAGGVLSVAGFLVAAGAASSATVVGAPVGTVLMVAGAVLILGSGVFAAIRGFLTTGTEQIWLGILDHLNRAAGPIDLASKERPALRKAMADLMAKRESASFPSVALANARDLRDIGFSLEQTALIVAETEARVTRQLASTNDPP